MSIAPIKMSSDAIYDMLEIFDVHPWIKAQIEDITELWNICENREEQNLLKALIKRFVYFNSDMESNACKAIANKIKEWDLKPTDTWIIAAANKTEIDGSTAGLQKLKNKVEPIEEWHSRFVSNIPGAIEKISEGQKIILFDDFIGSGQKMIMKTNWFRKLLGEIGIKDVTFYYLSFSGMEFGIKNLVDSTGCETYAFLNLKKGISDVYSPKEAENMIQIMVGIEGKLSERYKGKDLKDFSLGFGRTEALYCAQNDNCPNNVFPVFWWPKLKDGSAFRTIFKRAG